MQNFCNGNRNLLNEITDSDPRQGSHKRFKVLIIAKVKKRKSKRASPQGGKKGDAQSIRFEAYLIL